MQRMIRAAIVAVAVALAAPLAPIEPGLVQTAQAEAALLDINSATLAQLEALRGIGPVRAAAIISHRPYKRKDELVTKKVLSQSVYDGIKNLIIAKQ